MTLQITLLGPPRVEVDGRPLVVDTRKAIAMLAYLAVVGRPIARESLVELLWPDADSDGGRGALRRTLSTLRSALSGPWLSVDRHQVALSGKDMDVDVARFRAGAATAERADLAALAEAVSHFRGDFLEGFALRDSPAFDEWQLLEAEALRGELAQSLRRLATLEAVDGRAADAASTARRLLALDPLDEAAHRLLMSLHVEAGDRAAAIRQYRECERILARELGVAPGRETTDLYEAVRMAGGSRGPHQPSGRADTNDPTEGALLEAAAVLGDEVDPDLVASVGHVDRTAATLGLDELARRGVLREPAGEEPPERYRWVDVGMPQAIVGGLGIGRRRTLRERAGKVLAAAASSARAAGDHSTAARHYHAAAALGSPALGHPDRLAILEAIGDVETLRGRYGEALAAYESAAAVAPADALARLEHRLGSLHLRRGAPDLADLHLHAALARLGSAPSPLRARVVADQSLVAIRRGNLDAAGRLARASLRDARATRDPDSEARAENLLAMIARRGGDVLRARRHLRRSLERAGLAEDPAARIAALNGLALLERAAGNLDGALALTDEALRRCTVIGDRHHEAALRNNRADLLHELGRGGEASEELMRSVAAFAEVGERPGLEPEIWKLVEW